MAPFFLLISHLGHLVVRISHVHNSSERRYRRETDFVKLRVVDPRFGVPIYVKHPLSIRLGCTLDNGLAVAASIRRPWLVRLPDGIYCKRSATQTLDVEVSVSFVRSSDELILMAGLASRPPMRW
jgi:hypothetical protein